MKRFLALLIALLLYNPLSAQILPYGEFTSTDTYDVVFTLPGQDGAAAALENTGSGSIVLYESGNTTPITDVETLTVGYASVATQNQLILNLTDSDFEVGKMYSIVVEDADAAVDSVLLNTRVLGYLRIVGKTVLALMDGVPREMVIPASSSNAYAFNITLVDGSNTKVSATTGPTLTLVSEAGTDLSLWVTDTTPAASGTGVYPVTITVPNTATAKTLTLGISGSVTGYSGFNDEVAIHVTKSAYDKLTAANTLPGQGAPSATASLEDMVRYLYKAWLNPSTVTDNGDGTSTYRLKSNDGTTVDQKSTNSDDGTTYTKGKTVTGP